MRWNVLIECSVIERSRVGCHDYDNMLLSKPRLCVTLVVLLSPLISWLYDCLIVGCGDSLPWHTLSITQSAEPISTAIAIFAPWWQAIVFHTHFRFADRQQLSMNSWTNEAELPTSTHMPTYVPTYLSMYLSTYMPIYLSIYAYIFIYLYLPTIFPPTLGYLWCNLST